MTAEVRAKIAATMARLRTEDPLLRYGDADLRPSTTGITSTEGQAIAGCIERVCARRTVEIGFGFGLSTLTICEALLAGGQDASHTAVDPLQDEAYRGSGVRALEDAGIRAMVTVIAEPSEFVLPRLRQEGASFDLAFVDGNHRFEHVSSDLVHLGHLVRPSGVVFVDDTQLPAIAKAVAFTTSNLGWVAVDQGADGDLHHWVVLRTPKEPLARRYEDFTDF